jgi:hypothetical protein
VTGVIFYGKRFGEVWNRQNRGSTQGFLESMKSDLMILGPDEKDILLQ